ncbi:MAG: DUF4861 family protein [Bacteroidales bacterium]|nr:DUF4861 family protein [Bacteroidales bacterium]
MKKIVYLIIMAAMTAACQVGPAATAAIDGNGDCIFQNSLVCFKLNGAANPVVSDGIEAILKAKDMVKDRKIAQAASMNDGGSAVVVNDSLCFPHENFDSFEIVEQTTTHVTFSLHYPRWQAGEDSIELTRTITLRENSYFCEVSDVYESNDGNGMRVAAGFAKRNVNRSETGEDYIIVWENLPGDDGNMGVGIVMPMSNEFELEGPADHAVAYCNTRFGHKADYAVGCCWSKGKTSDFEQWAALVRP